MKLVILASITFFVASLQAVSLAQSPPDQGFIDRLEAGKQTKDLAAALRDVVQNVVIEAQVKQSVDKLLPVVKQALSSGAGGYLIRVDVYKSPEGVKILGNANSVAVVGKGTTPVEAAKVSIAAGTVSAKAPPGILRSDSDSYLIWITNDKGTYKYSRLSYPFSKQTFDRANDEVKKAAEDKKAAADKAKADKAKTDAADAARRVETARKAQEAAAAAQRAAQPPKAPYVPPPVIRPPPPYTPPTPPLQPPPPPPPPPPSRLP